MHRKFGLTPFLCFACALPQKLNPCNSASYRDFFVPGAGAEPGEGGKAKERKRGGNQRFSSGAVARRGSIFAFVLLFCALWVLCGGFVV